MHHDKVIGLEAFLDSIKSTRAKLVVILNPGTSKEELLKNAIYEQLDQTERLLTNSEEITLPPRESGKW